MEENANKLYFKYADFNSPTRVTVYSGCIYVFLSKSCPRRWIAYRYHVNCWQTLLWHLLWKICCETNWSQRSTSKRTVTWKIYLQSLRGKVAILNTDNIKIWGWITKLEAIKCYLFAFSFISAEYLQKIWKFSFPM